MSMLPYRKTEFAYFYVIGLPPQFSNSYLLCFWVPSKSLSSRSIVSAALFSVVRSRLVKHSSASRIPVSSAVPAKRLSKEQLAPVRSVRILSTCAGVSIGCFILNRLSATGFRSGCLAVFSRCERCRLVPVFAPSIQFYVGGYIKVNFGNIGVFKSLLVFGQV